MAKAAMTVIRGGRVLDIRGHAAPKADILVQGDTIAEIGRPGMAAPARCQGDRRQDRLLHPGLINGHTHSHGNLAKGMGDRLTLELLLTAGPWMSGNRTLEDKYLSSLIGAAEMVLKGCTAAYDLAASFPCRSVEGLGGDRPGLCRCRHARRAGADGGRHQLLRGHSRPDASACRPASRRTSSGCGLAPYKASIAQMKKALHGWKLDGRGVRLAVAPTIPHHCSRRVPARLPETLARTSTPACTPTCGIQGAGDRGLPALWLDARGLHGFARACSDPTSPWRTACGSTTTT